MTGASGQLGRTFLDFARRHKQHGNLELFGVASVRQSIACVEVAALDIGEMELTSALLNRIKPDRIFHFASPAHPALVEQRPELGKRLDVDATGVIARFAASNRAWMFFASSDFVHEGRATGLYHAHEPSHPVCEYGSFKAAGEEQVHENFAGAVGRISLMYDEGPECVPGSWLSIRDRLMRNAPVFGVTDEFRTPIRFQRVCEVIYSLARRDFRGVANISGEMVLSPLELITHLARRLNSTSQIIPVNSAEYFPRVPRPSNVALVSNSFSTFSQPKKVAEPISGTRA